MKIKNLIALVPLMEEAVIKDIFSRRVEDHVFPSYEDSDEVGLPPILPIYLRAFPEKHTGILIYKNGDYFILQSANIVHKGQIKGATAYVIADFIERKYVADPITPIELVPQQEPDKKQRDSTNVRKGTNHPYAKLKETDILEIRKRGKREQAINIAPDYGVSPGTIAKVLNRVSYRNIPD